MSIDAGDTCRAGKRVGDDGVCEGPTDAVKVADQFGEIAAGCLLHATMLVRQLRDAPGRRQIRILAGSGGSLAAHEVTQRSARGR